MGYNVLVVDDEEVFSSLTREQLINRGFDVEVVVNGNDAINYAKKNQPDAILLDVLLPGIDGLEVLRILQNDPQTKSIPVIVCSITCSEKKAISQLMAMGARDYMRKPCQPDDLAARVKKAVETVKK